MIVSKVLLPGSYDPMTLGHLDIIKRCSKMFSQVVVMVGNNNQKEYLLSARNRIEYIKDAVRNLTNVSVDFYDGLVVDYAYNHNIDFIVKGIRDENDLRYEKEMAYVNNKISLEKYAKGIETFYLHSEPEFLYTSSTLVRSLIKLDQPYSDYVHNSELLKELLTGKRL